MGGPNLLAVVVAAIIPMVVGMIWYSPVLFAKRWMALVGKTEEEIRRSGPAKAYALSFLAYIVMAYVLGHFVIYASAFTQTSGIVAGLQTGFWVWLGFVVTSSSSTTLFEFRPSGLYFIMAGYYLVCLLAMGVVLSVWR